MDAQLSIQKSGWNHDWLTVCSKQLVASKDKFKTQATCFGNCFLCRSFIGIKNDKMDHSRYFGVLVVENIQFQQTKITVYRNVYEGTNKQVCYVQTLIFDQNTKYKDIAETKMAWTVDMALHKSSI